MRQLAPAFSGAILAPLEEVQRIDEAEDGRYGNEKRGDELPEELQRRESRLRKTRKARVELEQEAREKTDASEPRRALALRNENGRSRRPEGSREGATRGPPIRRRPSPTPRRIGISPIPIHAHLRRTEWNGQHREDEMSPVHDQRVMPRRLLRRVSHGVGCALGVPTAYRPASDKRRASSRSGTASMPSETGNTSAPG